MAEIDDIKSAIQIIATKLSLTIIRAEQTIEKQTYPYCTFKVLNLGRDNRYEKKWKDNIDETKIDIETQRYKVASISFSVLDKSSPLVAYETAEQVMDYLLSDEGINDFDTNGFQVVFDSQQIQDRTSLIEPVYEYKVGFDFRLFYNSVHLQTVDAIDVDLTIQEMNVEVL